MRIVDLRPEDTSAISQVAALLVEGFAPNWPEAWPNLVSAIEEVRESFFAKSKQAVFIKKGIRNLELFSIYVYNLK